jgi:hypothetical protein
MMTTRYRGCLPVEVSLSVSWCHRPLCTSTRGAGRHTGVPECAVCSTSPQFSRTEHGLPSSPAPQWSGRKVGDAFCYSWQACRMLLHTQSLCMAKQGKSVVYGKGEGRGHKVGCTQQLASVSLWCGVC